MSVGLGSISILHVDDDSDFRDLVAAFLQNNNEYLHVETVGTPSNGLQTLSSRHFDCVVSDYEMPRTNGIEFLEQVREIHSDIPFILYTGKGSEEIASEAISAGVTDYLQKQSGTGQYTVLANRIKNAVEQYHAKRSVSEAEEKLAQIADKTDDILYMFNGDWTELLFINSAYEEVWGGSIATLRDNPESFLDWIHPEDQGIAKTSMQKLSNGEPDVVEYRVKVDDDDWRWVKGESKPILNDEGNVERIVGFVRDITGQKRQTEKLKQTTARFEAIFENSPELIAIHDADGNIRDYNRRFKQELGYTDAEISEMKVWDIDTAADPQRAREFWDQLPPNTPRRFEGALQRNDNTEFPVEIHLVRMDLAGKDRFVAMDRGISEQKAREEELLRQNERLDEFANVISHDLRNPLEVAQGRLELLETDSEHAEAIGNALERMDDLLSDLLTLAHEGEAALEFEPINVAETARRAWTTVAVAEASLVTNTSLTISADRDQVQQLFENLFRNAIEHGGTTVTVTIGSLDNGFYVEDTGPGISEEHRDQIFDIGFSTSSSGTGYGLNIIEQIASNHDWEIQLTESDNGGARFEVTNVESRNEK